jgi:hypothetical protein
MVWSFLIKFEGHIIDDW